MNDKAQANIFLNPLVILAIVFIITALFIWILSADVVLEVSIPQTEFEIGEDISLYYKIENKLLWGDISNVIFNYHIEDYKGLTVKIDKEIIGEIEVGNSVKNTISIGTYDLSRGDYILWTNIDYYWSGIREAKYLSLRFSIV